MHDWRVRWGVGLGVCVAAVLIATGRHQTLVHGSAPTHPGALLSDCTGTFDSLVIQYVPNTAHIVEKAYRSFLASLPGDVTVYVVCPEMTDFNDLVQRVGEVSCSLSAVTTGHAMTPWSRDRWLALSPSGCEWRTTLLSAHKEAGARMWPERRGDQRIGEDLANALPELVASVRSGLLFDGGDFVADQQAVFVSCNVLRRNMGRTVRTVDELTYELSIALKRRIVLLPTSPAHHAGMYMMTVGDGTVMVGDPGMAARELSALPEDSAMPCPPCGADFSPETQRAFDSVARICEEAGHPTVRIPVIPGSDGRTYVTYTNVVMDQRGDKRAVYMPIYEGADVLNDSATKVWRSLGYEVVQVDCTDVYVHFGSLRCLVNVLGRR